MDNAIQDSQSTSLSLLERVRHNDASGWIRLTELYGPLVYRWCRSLGLDETDAADVGQEVFQTVFRSLNQFERGRQGAFRSWLKTITRTRSIDWRRGQPPEIPADGNDFAAPPDREDSEETTAEVEFLYKRAMQLIQVDFAEATWKAFVAVVVEERDVRDVARELGLTPNAIYIARSRILARLRSEFADLID